MIESKRLILRNLTQNDLPAIYAYRNDARVGKYQRYDRTDEEYLREFIERYSGSRFLSTEAEQHYAICQKSGKIIGDLSIFYSAGDNCFTLGITVSHENQGFGYAYEMLSEVIAKLCRQYPGVDIVALIEKENTASIGLFKKLGFVEEGYSDEIKSYVYVIYGN